MKNKSIISRYKVIKKGSLMIMRTSVLTALFVAVSLFASSGDNKDRLGDIERKINTVINKAGIQLNGTFRSQYLSSSIEDNSGDSSVNWGKKRHESNEYTSVDFDIMARPNDALSGRLIFRMHQNWQNFFSDISNPIFSRWISIDGNVKNMFRFNVGDFRQHYSPLTLWSPDIEIAYEPEIFAEKRRQAMSEVFLGNNDRLLQGINFNFDAELVPIFNEVHLNVNTARLRLAETGWTNGSGVTDRFEKAPKMDRYMTGVNLDLLALRGLGFGGTFLGIFDYVPSFNGAEAVARVDSTTRFGLVYGGRVNPSTRIFLDSDVFEAGINFEYIISGNRDSAWYDITPNAADPAASPDSVYKTRMKNGGAMDVGLDGNVKIGDLAAIKFNLGFMSNDPDYGNELAQSPTFYGQRIMNIENDFASGGNLYTTFDALYDYVFKFAPSANNQWTKEPHRKISYVNAILTRDEIEKAVDMQQPGKSLLKLDPTLQLVLPYGPATPNRSGPKGDLSLEFFEGGIDAGVNFAVLSEIESEDSLSGKTSFVKFGGGLSVDIATWAKILNCMKLSFGYMTENAKNTITDVGDVTSNNSFMNIGLYYNFWQRFSLLAGYQRIVNERTVDAEPATGLTITQTHWAAGLEYKVAAKSKVIGRFGKIGATRESDPTDADDENFDFSIWQTELFLTVDF
jgi:hypothetical protein